MSSLCIILKHIRNYLANQISEAYLQNDRQFVLENNPMKGLIIFAESQDYKDLIKEEIYQAQFINIPKIYNEEYKILRNFIKEIMISLVHHIEWEEIQSYLVDFLRD
ncbi:MAG: hypothetical protein KDH96_13125 [Candidatus Riesia sp.]|nr:hypothetical protein [Candidatus Riesia sp.]